MRLVLLCSVSYASETIEMSREKFQFRHENIVCLSTLRLFEVYFWV